MDSNCSWPVLVPKPLEYGDLTVYLFLMYRIFSIHESHTLVMLCSVDHIFKVALIFLSGSESSSNRDYLESNNIVSI